MPGLSGIVSSKNRLENPSGILETFEKVHALKGISFIHRHLQTPHCVISNTLTGLLKASLEQPASDPAENTWLFLEGEIFGAPAQPDWLSEARGISLCEMLLALYLGRGIDFVSMLNGEFNIVIYQRAENRLVILNDHIASKPLYYMHSGDQLLFGSEKKAILAASRRPLSIDPVGILQVFAHVHNVGGRTFINEIKSLPPASCLEYRDGQLLITHHPTIGRGAPQLPVRTQSLIEKWCTQLQQAAIERVKEKQGIVISLSGGLDSRAIACAIPRTLRPISARTRGALDSLESRYAAAIADRLGIDHFCEDPTVMPLSAALHRIVWRTECAIAFTHCLSLPNHPVIRQRGSFLASGVLGDVSSGGHISLVMFAPHSRDEFIRMVYRRYVCYSESALQRVFNTEFLRSSLPLLEEVFLRSFDSLKCENNVQLYEMWDLYERQTHLTLASAPVDTHLFEHIRPFLDKNYLDFVLTIPTRLRFGQILYQAMIYNLGPEIRDVPNANTDQRLSGTLVGNAFRKAVSLEVKASTKLARRIKPSYQNRIERFAPEDLALGVRRDLPLRNVIEDFVHSSCFDSSIFNGPGIQSLLDRHYSGKTDRSDLLCTLATFAVGLPYFVYNRPDCCPSEAEPLN